MPLLTTPGRLMIAAALPPDLRDDNRSLNQANLSDLMAEVGRKYPEQYASIVFNLERIGIRTATTHGRTMSIGLDDLTITPTLAKIRNELKAEFKRIYTDPKLSQEAKQDLIVKNIGDRINDIQKEIKNTPFGVSSVIDRANTGARGNAGQVMQLLVGDVLSVDHRDHPVPYPSLTSYSEGADTAEYWAGAPGARKGFVGVQLGTPRGGFASKQLKQATHRVVVTEPDCGTDAGFIADGDDSDNVGQVLAFDAGELKAGTVIEKKHLKQLADHKIRLRSTLTCQAKNGVCAKCAGHTEEARFPDIGSYLGLSAASAISEPLTQMHMTAKHTGGQMGEGVKTAGFDDVNRMLQVPSSYSEWAPVATLDGSISSIDKAPQGGWKVFVNSVEHYIPASLKLAVKTGDRLEAGDVLTDGIPHPGLIAKYKGLGEARLQYTKDMRNLLKIAKAPAHRRNVEVVARGFLNLVSIDDNDGVQSWFPGDIVPYDDLARDWEPRPGSTLKLAKEQIGSYMEAPYLHYTIGTRVTPRVADNLKQAGISVIMANKQPAPFSPVIMRAQDSAAHDPDWMARLAGFGLEKSFLDAVQHGSTSDIKGTSYVPKLVEADL